MSRTLRQLVVLAGVIMALALAGAGSAAAHPLGNFTVNHYAGLTIHLDRVDVLAVVDSAEIPTLQQHPQVDTDGDGTVSGIERQAYAATQCDQLSGTVRATVDGEPLRFTVRSAEVSYPPGQADLPTTRLTCQLSAPAQLGEPATLSFRDGFGDDRIGWREITAVGRGVGLPQSPVPARSISDELHSYPNDLLAEPLDVRDVTLRTVPGGASSLGSASGGNVSEAGEIERLLGWGTDRFTEFVGAQLTPLVGVLAVLLSLVLGASHAALPGHGKTLIAAYLAGRHGTTRDALLVGTTVTVTHTAGVLVVGLLLSAFATLIGEQLLGWLGVLSGLLVTVIGASLLRAAVRARRDSSAQGAPAPTPALVGAVAGHGHSHGHDHRQIQGHGHSHFHGHGHEPALAGGDRLRRPALLGMGVAAGLVPSPSALLVLLAAIGLGRTWFGVLLVLGYGLGMAATLTAVGLLLVRLRDRVERRLARARDTQWLTQLAATTPTLTAALVLIVGLGLVARSLSGTV
ncbi:MAG: sulfite exporter TauE/SafE family protein [Pseudonocardiaceae bacterium]